MKNRVKTKTTRKINCRYGVRERLFKEIDKYTRYGLDVLRYSNLYKTPRHLFPNDKDKRYIRTREGRYNQDYLLAKSAGIQFRLR